jgi:hypothetical protein
MGYIVPALNILARIRKSEEPYHWDSAIGGKTVVNVPGRNIRRIPIEDGGDEGRLITVSSCW